MIKKTYSTKFNSLAFLFLIISILFLSGCTQQPINPRENTIVIENLLFKPNTLTISNGTTVTWVNNDSADHTIISDDNIFRSGTLTKGQNFTYTFTTLGTYDYYCNIHPSMRGKIVVQ